MRQSRSASGKSIRNSITQQANYRGIFAVRREISPVSYGTMQKVADSLSPELHNAARIFDVRSIGVTVIGFSRFDRRHCGKGPKTASITEQISTAHRPLEVRLGNLAVYGAEINYKNNKLISGKHKLAVEVYSEDLIHEEREFEAAFEDAGYPLKREHNGDGTYAPHLSVALLYGDYVGQFADPRTLSKLDAISGLGRACGQSITLNPVSDPPYDKD